jgi:excisionase family DNA binding protein
MNVDAKLDRIITLLELLVDERARAPAPPPPPSKGGRLLTVAEAAVELGVSRSVAYRLVKEMPHVRVGLGRVGTGAVRVSAKTIAQYIETRTIAPSPWSPVDVNGRARRVKYPRATSAVPLTYSATSESSWRRTIQPRTKPKW